MLTAKGLQPLTRVQDIGLGFVTPQMYAVGIIGDGVSRALSTVFATLAAAQVVYSFVTSLTQTLDYAALQKMIYEALGYPGFEHADADAYLNKAMQIAAGQYVLGASTLSIRNASGVRIEGAGRRATRVIGSDVVFATDGFWYSQVTGVDFETTGAVDTAVDIDGNVPGHPYSTRGVQANTFKDCRFDAGTVADYAFALTRLGNPGGGAQGSENLFLNCHFDNSVVASFFSTGFNALQNTFIGGNFQGHQKDGIHFDAGSFYIFSVGFQSTHGYDQIVNDGYDINSNFGGVDDRIVVIGCRTESLRFYRGGASQPPILIGNLQTSTGLNWGPLTAYTLNQYTIQTSLTLGRKLYRVTTAGTSGGDAVTNSDIFSSTTIGKTGRTWTVNGFTGWRVSIVDGTGAGQTKVITSNTATTLTVPTWTTTPDATSDFIIDPTGMWPDSGTFTDGSVVWTMTDFDAIKISGGQLISNRMYVGFVSQTSMIDSPTREITANYLATLEDELILCANTSDITVTLPVFTGTASNRQAGKKFTIKKVLTNSATVSVVSADGGFLDGAGGAAVIPGGSLGWITAEMAGGGAVAARHWIISRNLDPDPRIRRLVPNLGTTLVAGDFALSAGWGTTAAVSFPSGNAKDSRGLILVTSNGTGQAANPTVTLTFKDGAWPSNGPFAMVCRGAGSQRTVPVTVSSVSGTTLVIRFEGTPVAAETYEIYWIVEG